MNAEPINVLLAALTQPSAGPGSGLQKLAALVMQSRRALADSAERFARLAARVAQGGPQVRLRQDDLPAAGLMAALLALPEAPLAQMAARLAGTQLPAAAAPARFVPPGAEPLTASAAAVAGCTQPDDQPGGMQAARRAELPPRLLALQQRAEARREDYQQGIETSGRRLTTLLPVAERLAAPLLARIVLYAGSGSGQPQAQGRPEVAAMAARETGVISSSDASLPPPEAGRPVNRRDNGPRRSSAGAGRGDQTYQALQGLYQRLTPRFSRVPQPGARGGVVHQLLSAGAQQQLMAGVTLLSVQSYQALSQRLELPAVSHRTAATASHSTGRAPWESELRSARQAAAVALQQETNIYLQGTSNVQQVADSVVSSQFDVNSQLIQRLQREPI